MHVLLSAFTLLASLGEKEGPEKFKESEAKVRAVWKWNRTSSNIKLFMAAPPIVPATQEAKSVSELTWVMSFKKTKNKKQV